MEITREVKVTIEGKELIGLLVDTLYLFAKSADGKGQTYYTALAQLVNVSDVEAVKIANRKAKESGQPTITTEEFRRWLPIMLAAAFDDFMGVSPLREAIVE